MTIIFAMAIFAIVLAYAFEACNGFHDTAHACATSVASGALTYRQAVWMSGIFNALGAATAGTAVAVFITKIVSTHVISMQLVVSTLLAGLVWNLYTWYKGIPVSSSHCLIGSLVGAGLAAAGWSGVNLAEFYKALISLFTSPFIGFVLAMIVARVIVRFAGKPGTSATADKWMPWAQRATAAAVSYGHGANDGQKTMGIVTLILIAGFGYGDVASIGGKLAIPMWVVLTCAATIGLGTVFGARRIIDTVANKLSVEKITYHDGLAAESVTAVLVLWGSHLGLPLSTTQTCTSSVLGASRGVHRRDTLNWVTIRKMVAAWIATFITTGALAASFYLLLHHLVG
jgi:PiT family inorganic phosphate transporter